VASPDLAQMMRDAAPAISAVVYDAPDMSKALDYVVSLCEQKSPAVLLVDEPGTETGPVDEESGRPTRAKRVLAAPDLPKKTFDAFTKQCEAKGWQLVRDNIRAFASGVDIGVNLVDHAIADTATCIIQTTNEDVLLASAVCEISVIIVPTSGLLPDMRAALPLLRDFMKKKTKAGGTYSTFITGSSRTGDIEQVLTLGAHGPIELHIILLEG